MDFGFNEEESQVKKVALNNSKIKKILKDKEIKRIIFVPNKVLNIVS